MTSFIIQTVIVVGYLLMIEQFFLEFAEFIQKGFAEIKSQPAVSSMIMDYSGSADGTVRSEESIGVTKDTANTTLTQGGIKNLGELMFNLVQMLIVIIMSFSFLKELPSMAAYLAGNPRFAQVMSTHFTKIEKKIVDPVQKYFNPEDTDFNPGTKG